MNARQRVVMVVLFAVASVVEAGSISGNLKLPTPYSQTGDMQIRVLARSTSTNHFRSQTLTITAAQASAGALFAFSVSSLNDAEFYQLVYSCQPFTFPKPCEKIVSRAYYKATNQSVFRSAEAAIFAGSADHPSLELPIMLGKIISGSINIPGSQMAPIDGIKVGINAFTVNSPVTALSVDGFIEEGQPMDTYQIMIPDDFAETWEIGYRCEGFRNPNGACEDFLTAGYFNSTATNTTAELRVNAEDLPGDLDSPGINMTLLSGFTITGILSIPSPPTEAAGIQLTMSARDANNAANNATDSINIAMGAGSETFEITIPKEEDADWRIRYDCEATVTPVECSKYIDVGYFDSSVSGSMTSTNIMNATQLVGGESHSGINFSIISGFAISGKLMLSDGVAPAGGISFTVNAQITSGGSGNVLSQISIPEGQSETSFRLNVDTDASKMWRVGFDCLDVFTPVCLEIADVGYYDATTGQTVETPEGAASLAGGMDHPNIVLTVESSALQPDEICVPIRASNNAIAVLCL